MRRSLLGLVALCVGLLSLATTVSAYKSKKDFEGGTISGIVKFQGAPPPRKTLEVNKNKDVCGKNPIQDDSLVVGSNGGVQWAVARLVGIESGKKWEKKTWGKKQRFMDQNGCFFSPHIRLLRRKKSVRIINSDGVLHNFHTFPKKNKVINRAQPKFLKKMTLKGKKFFSKPEIMNVKCDVHGWMNGYIVVAEHPYYAVTGGDGKFKLTNIPPGKYKLEFWHETLGTHVQALTVKGKETISVTVSMKK